MKKIGILTFHNADNYGALLQAYALKKTLNNMGNDTHIINYFCPKLQKDYKLVNFGHRSFISILKQIVKFVFLPLSIYIRSRFSSFRKQYLINGNPIYPNTIDCILNDYDIFIAGSDQVFNPNITGFDSNYFLAFNKDRNKNFSYAASFGLSLNDLSDKEKQFFKQNMLNFKQLSFREQQGKEISNIINGHDCEVSLDPTLLLTKNDWEKIAIPPKQKKYILLYLMSKDSNIISFAKKLAKKTKCKLIFISPALDLKNRVPAYHVYPTPQEWLGYFLNAKYIVTNSFHGLAFSINFNKDFFVDLLPPPSKVNSRLENLLDLTGLRGRLISAGANLDTPAPDWAEVNAKLAAEKEKSLSYLRSIAE